MKVKRQHTIPNFLLKNFNEKQVTIADFKTQKVFKASPSKISVIKNFYEEHSNFENEIEQNLALNEAEVSNVIKKFTKSDMNITITPNETLALVKFLMVLPHRTISSMLLQDNEPRDFWEAKSRARNDNNKKNVHNDLRAILLLDVKYEIEVYRKWYRNFQKKISSGKIMSKHARLLEDMHRKWNKKNIYSLRIMRELHDWSLAKIILITHDFDDNLLGSTFSAGKRSMQSGAVMYYEFAISSRKSIIVLHDEYSNDENIYHKFIKKTKRITFKKNYEIVQHKLSNSDFFMANIYKINEERAFLIAKDLNMLFDAIKHFIHYLLYVGFQSNNDLTWINQFIMDNLTTEFEKEADEYKKMKVNI